MTEINLISDTVTKPTPDMLKYMFSAEVGDDVFKSDPTVNMLEEKASAMFGMDCAIFCPSGTMTNQIAIKLHTQPGDMLIASNLAHVYNFEAGGVAFNSGVTCNLIQGARGMFTASSVRDSISPNDMHHPPTSLVVVENTTNKGGGACWDFKELEKIRKICSENNLAFHLDGARLFNAMAVKGETPKQYGKIFDTISICLSKGLGAPVGSLLLMNSGKYEKAIRTRKVLGGAMRQSGFLAAAGIYALDNHVERIVEDHKKAKIIADELRQLSFIKYVEPAETNILIFNINDDINEKKFIDKLAAMNIKIVSMGNGKLRIVTHLDFTDEMLYEFIKRIKSLKL